MAFMKLHPRTKHSRTRTGASYDSTNPFVIWYMIFMISPSHDLLRLHFPLTTPKAELYPDIGASCRPLRRLLGLSLIPLLAVLLAGVASAEIKTSDVKGRRLHIEGGELTSPRRYEYVLSVVRKDSTYLCAGSLIAPGLALTAAHCVAKAAGGTVNPDVTLGRSSVEQIFGYERFQTRSVVHPLYVAGQFDYDVALLFLSDITTITPVRLASAAQQAPNGTLRVLGWGATEGNTLSAVLRDADLTQLPLDTCVGLFEQFGSMVTRRMLCMTGKTCAGDSGGPLVQVGDGSGQDTLFGQVSFGFPRAKGRGCPNPNPATVFTDLAAPRLNLWIRQAIQIQASSPEQNPSALHQVSADLAENAVNVDYPDGK